MLNGNFRRAGLAASCFLGVSLLVYFTGIARCPVAAVLGVPCPACGSTRAVRALVHFDFATALRFNPMAPIAACLLLVLAGRVLFLLARTGDARDVGEGPWGRLLIRALLLTVSLEIAVWLVRFTGLLGGPVPV